MDIEDYDQAEAEAEGSRQAHKKESGKPRYTIKSEGGSVHLLSLKEILKYVMEVGTQGMTIQRYKGLGEMNPEQLWETTMNPEVRTMKRVSMEDAVEADKLFAKLMGDEVEPRRQYLEANAKYVQNLDV